MSQDPNFSISSSESETPSTSPVSTLSTLLPPQNVVPENPTIVLDLDKTLIYSTDGQDVDHLPERYDFILTYEIDGHLFTHYTIKRPGLDEFLLRLSAKYELVIFTAGIREYASLALDTIDPRRLISHRLYRDSCTEIEGKLVKDLSKIGRDVKKTILIDDNPEACIFFQENVIILPEFIDNFEDESLIELGEFLEECSEYEDMRVAVAQVMHNDDDSGDNS